MLKAMLLLLLVAASAGASARETVWTWDTHAPPKRGEKTYPDAASKWVEIGSQKTYVIFVNPATIRKIGNNVEMIHLYELQIIDSVDGKPIRSVEEHSEFDCMKAETRTLSAAAYSGSMGKADPNFGNGQFNNSNPANILPVLGSAAKIYIRSGRSGVVNTISEPGKWKPVAAGSTDEILMEFACKK